MTETRTRSTIVPIATMHADPQRVLDVLRARIPGHADYQYTLAAANGAGTPVAQQQATHIVVTLTGSGK